MLTEDEFYEWIENIQVDKYWEDFYGWYVKAVKFDTLVELGVDNWSGYGDAMQSLEEETINNEKS